MKIKPAVKLDLGEMCKFRLLFFVSREYLIAYIYSLIQTQSLAKYVVRFHLLQIRFLQWIQYSCRYITKWKQTSNFSQLDRVYVPIRKKIYCIIYIYIKIID